MVSTGMPLAREFSRTTLGFAPVLLKRKLIGVGAKYSSEVPVVSTGTWTARLEDGTEVEKSTRLLHDNLVLVPGYEAGRGACAAHIEIGCSNKTDQCRTACGALLSSAGPREQVCPGKDCKERIRDKHGRLIAHGQCHWGAQAKVFHADLNKVHIYPTTGWTMWRS